MILIAYRPARALIRSVRDPAADELRYLKWLESRPQPQEMRQTGFRFLIGGPALLWAAYRADLSLLWAALGSFVVFGGLIYIWVSSTEAARSHEADRSALGEPPAVHARRRRITQACQLVFLVAWFFSWRGLAV